MEERGGEFGGIFNGIFCSCGVFFFVVMELLCE